LRGGELVVVHGDRAGPVGSRHDWLRRRYPAARAVVYGHSHRLTCDQAAFPWVLNPGSAGRTRTYGGPSCMVLAIDRNEWLIETLRFEPLRKVPRVRGSGGRR
jgi:predicted phosphodiesterase